METGVQCIELRVVARRQEADGIVSFELSDLAGRALPPFTAGAHIEVMTPGGATRQYSLCNDPAETSRYVIAVLDEPQSRGGSRSMHTQVSVGDTLRASVPSNHFALEPQARETVLVAGGIGITPLLSMAHALTHAGSPFRMHYCARSRSRMAFSGAIAASRFAERVSFHTDDGPDAQRFDLNRALGAASPDRHLYVCGPSGLIDHVLSGAVRLGWPASNLHHEYFAAPEEPVSDRVNRPLEVVIASTGEVIPVPADVSVASALMARGVVIPMSCEEGVCGTCVTSVLEGDPDHRDHYLTEADRSRNDCFMPCCSRARGDRLVLDL